MRRSWINDLRILSPGISMLTAETTHFISSIRGEWRAQDCANNPDCLTVKLNIVLDKHADIYGKDGNLKAEYRESLDKQIALAQDEYGTIGINLDVSYSKGEMDRGFIKEGMQTGSVNVAVTDNNGMNNTIDRGRSRMGSLGPVILLHAGRSAEETLSHELAHHFSGDTKTWNPFGILANALADNANDPARASFGGKPAFSQTYEKLSYGLHPYESVRGAISLEHPWRAGARSLFQRAR